MDKFLEVDGMQLRRLRRARALSQRDLARITGIAQDTISQLETGKREAQPRTIRRLAEALSVEPSTLMKEE
ncbi:MAG TPA: helix-turn-helix transcriptional regulator [Rubrobacteraceae bacterium]|jgi:transcriptional regulator with XRE-family HTH domain|nr:helix-turn-helix transcriptional regulator [Rubrobacteraceae bacterium]